LTDGNASKTITAKELEESQDNGPLMKNILRMIAREDEELSVFPSRGLGMINMCRTKKRWLLLLSVIHASRSRLCATTEMHRRGIAHRMDMAHRE
jgi:hypothetical protein